MADADQPDRATRTAQSADPDGAGRQQCRTDRPRGTEPCLQARSRCGCRQGRRSLPDPPARRAGRGRAGVIRNGQQRRGREHSRQRRPGRQSLAARHRRWLGRRGWPPPAPDRKPGWRQRLGFRSAQACGSPPAVRSAPAAGGRPALLAPDRTRSRPPPSWRPLAGAPELAAPGGPLLLPPWPRSRFQAAGGPRPRRRHARSQPRRSWRPRGHPARARRHRCRARQCRARKCRARKCRARNVPVLGTAVLRSAVLGTAGLGTAGLGSAVAGSPVPGARCPRRRTAAASFLPRSAHVTGCEHFRRRGPCRHHWS